MKKIITSIAAAAALSSSLFAGTITMTSDGNVTALVAPLSVSSSLVKNAEYNVISDSYITYTPTTAIGEGFTAVVTIANGAFAAGNDWTLDVSGVTAPSNDTLGDAAGTLTDFTANANGDYTSMTFVFSDPTSSDGFDYNTQFTLNKGTATNWAINIAQGATANVTVAVPSVKTATALELVAPVAAASSVLTIGSPLSATFANDAAGNIIDVEAGRLVFTAGGTDGDVATAQGTLTVSEGTANIKYDLSSNLDTWTLTLKGDFAGVAGIDVNGTAMTPNVAAPALATSYTLSSDFSVIDLTAGHQIILDTDGTTVLDTRTLTAELTINDSNDNVNVAPA